MSAPLIAILLLIAVLGFAGAMMVAAYFRQRIDWKPLGATAVKYVNFAENVTEADIQRAYADALVLLRRHTDFTPLTLTKLSTELHITVQRVAAWNSPEHGTKVAGIADGVTVAVGADLKSLLHEMAHVCEFFEGHTDFDHASWVKRGIQKADDEFNASRQAKE